MDTFVGLDRTLEYRHKFCVDPQCVHFLPTSESTGYCGIRRTEVRDLECCSLHCQLESEQSDSDLIVEDYTYEILS